MPDSEPDLRPAEYMVVATGDFRAFADPGRQPRRSHPFFWTALGLFVVVYAAMFVVGRYIDSPVGDFIVRLSVAGLEVLPFVPLILFTTLGRDIRPFRFVTLAYWLILAIVGIAGNTMMAAGAVVDGPQFHELAKNAPDRMLEAFPLGSFQKISAVVILSIGAVVAGLLGFTAPVRHWASRWLPLDPESFSDAVALASVVAITLGCFVPLIVLHQPPMLLIAKNFADDLAGMGSQASLFDLYARLYWMVPVALLAAGWPLIRDLPAALRRLGLVMPSAGQLLFVPVGTLFLIGLVLAVERGIGVVWKHFNLPVTDEKTFETLIKFAISLAGAVAIGVTAGIWEEVVFRGLLQPRVGIWPANFLFTAMHAQQYHLDGLLIVFLIGLILGRIRERTNTTTAALIHGSYDFILVLAAAYKWFEPAAGN